MYQQKRQPTQKPQHDHRPGSQSTYAPVSPHGFSTTSILSMQRTLGNRGTIQRLRKYPTITRPTPGSSETVTDLNAVPQVINIGTLNYQQAHHYRDIYNQQQVDPSAHPDYVFDNGDIDQIDLLISQLEPNEAQVICTEGEKKVAIPTQTITYGDVTTCMTITAVMGDGTKVTAHEGMFGRVPGGAIAAIQGLIAGPRVPNKTIARVLAAGVGWAWTTRLNLAGTVLGERAVENDRGGFENYLSQQFGGATASFVNHDGGVLMINAGGHKV